MIIIPGKKRTMQKSALLGLVRACNYPQKGDGSLRSSLDFVAQGKPFVLSDNNNNNNNNNNDNNDNYDNDNSSDSHNNNNNNNNNNKLAFFR